MSERRQQQQQQQQHLEQQLMLLYKSCLSWSAVAGSQGGEDIGTGNKCGGFWGSPSSMLSLDTTADVNSNLQIMPVLTCCSWGPGRGKHWQGRSGGLWRSLSSMLGLQHQLMSATIYKMMPVFTWCGWGPERGRRRQGRHGGLWRSPSGASCGGGTPCDGLAAQAGCRRQ